MHSSGILTTYVGAETLFFYIQYGNERQSTVVYSLNHDIMQQLGSLSSVVVYCLNHDITASFVLCYWSFLIPNTIMLCLLGPSVELDPDSIGTMMALCSNPHQR